MAKINLGLNVGKNKSGLFFFWLGHELGPISKWGPRGPAGAGPGPRKKPGILIEAGSGQVFSYLDPTRGARPMAQTRPV